MFLPTVHQPLSQLSAQSLQRQDTIQPRRSASAAGPSPTQVFRNALSLPPLVPPLRFHLVASTAASNTARLFSSSHPLPRHLPFLSRLKLKTLLALTPDHPARQVPAIEQWASTQGVNIVWLKIQPWKDAGATAITKDIAQEAISMLISSSAAPVLLISLTPGPSALVVALLHLLQGYPLDFIHPEIHRGLRAGLEGEADEDDKEDCEKWIKGWVGKDLNLALPRSQVQEWTWPQATTLRWLRLTEPRTQLAPPTHATLPFHLAAPASFSGSGGQSSSLDSPFAPHRSATTVHGSTSSDLVFTTPQVTHPFLKIKFEPEPVLPLHLDPPVLNTAAGTTARVEYLSIPGALSPTVASVPSMVKSSGPAPGLATQNMPSLRMPVGFKGRKRSLTISEGRGGETAAAAVNAMMEAAAAAAINATSLEIDTIGALKGGTPLGATSGSAPPTAASFSAATLPLDWRADPATTSTTFAPTWRWGNEPSQQQHRECFPSEYEQSSNAHAQSCDSTLSSSSDGNMEEEEDEEGENSTPKATARPHYLLHHGSAAARSTGSDGSNLTSSERSGASPSSSSSSSAVRRSPERPFQAPRRLSEIALAALDACGEGQATPTKCTRSASRSRGDCIRATGSRQGADPHSTVMSATQAQGGEGGATSSQHATGPHAEVQDVDEEDDEDDEDDYHQDDADDFSEGLEALDLA